MCCVVRLTRRSNTRGVNVVEVDKRVNGYYYDVVCYIFLIDMDEFGMSESESESENTLKLAF